MIICEDCGAHFFLGEVPGAAGLTPDLVFVGRCPRCGHRQSLDVDFPLARYSDPEVLNVVQALELASDNLCQRVVDLLWERNWRAHYNGVMQ